jgi:hypothetical protein
MASNKSDIIRRMAHRGAPGRVKKECSAALTAELCEVLEEGMPLNRACEFVGLPQKLFDVWMERGEPGYDEETEEIIEAPQPYYTFWQEVTKALHLAERRALRVIQSGPKNWQASAWYLERTRPKDYGKQEDKGPQQAGLTVQVYLPDNSRGEGGMVVDVTPRMLEEGSE